MILISCEMRFDLDIPQESSKLYAFCVPGAQDTTAILIDVARYTGDYNRYDISKAEVHFRINGESQEVIFNADKAVKSLPEKCFYVTTEIHPDDRISMTASLDGLQEVSAQTEIPPYPENMEFTIGKPDKNNQASLSIRYKDDSDDSYYAVMLREKETTIHWSIIDGTEQVREYFQWQPLNIGYEYDPFQMYPEFNIRVFHNHQGVCFWKNADIFQDGDYKQVSFDIYIKKDVEHKNWMQRIDYSYEANLYRITEDLYNYYMSDCLNSENYLSYYGMADIGPVNSNVDGGFGILAGMARRTMIYDTDYTVEDNYLPEP